MSCCVGIICSHGELLTEQTSFSGKGEQNPPKTECGCLLGGVIWRRSLRRSSLAHPMGCTCTGVGEHTGRPSECSAEERYNNNNNSNNNNNNNNSNKQQDHLDSCLPWFPPPEYSRVFGLFTACLSASSVAFLITVYTTHVMGLYDAAKFPLSISVNKRSFTDVQTRDKLNRWWHWK